MAVDALPVIVILLIQYRWLLSFRAVVVVENLGIPISHSFPVANRHSQWSVAQGSAHGPKETCLKAKEIDTSTTSLDPCHFEWWKREWLRTGQAKRERKGLGKGLLTHNCLIEESLPCKQPLSCVHHTPFFHISQDLISKVIILILLRAILPLLSRNLVLCYTFPSLLHPLLTAFFSYEIFYVFSGFLLES